MFPKATHAPHATMTSSPFSSVGFWLLLVALLPGLKSSWHYAEGGVATREWSFGVPWSPLVTLKQVGSGPFDAIVWSFPAPELHLVSLSFPFLLAYFMAEGAARWRKGKERILSRSAGQS